MPGVLTRLLGRLGARPKTVDAAVLVQRARSLRDAGEFAEAAICYERALADSPAHPEALLGRAELHRYAGEFDEAASLLDDAIRAAPASAATWAELGLLERSRGHLEASLQAFRRSAGLECRSGIVACVGGILFQLGRIEEALGELDRALAIDPEADFIHSNRLFILNHDPRLTPEQVAQAHFEWGRDVEARKARWRVAHEVDRDPSRRLRVGFVSPDLRMHSVAFFMAPVLELLDREAFEVHVYDCQAGPGDSMTVRLQELAERWVRIGQLDDESFARRIRADRIDILIDLAGHTGGNRLPVFAMKPAPVAVTWFGYMNTTGLRTIDYRLSDASLCPPGREGLYSERIWRMPGTAVWSPAPGSTEPSDSPVARRGVLRFGSFNNWAKVSGAVLDTWAEILRRCEGAELLVVAAGGDAPERAAQVRAEFVARGIDGRRIVVLGTRPLDAFLRVIDDTDIALDPFPYNGGTTTLHTLWMGVPVVSMTAISEVGHVAYGLLAPVGLANLCATTPEGYVEAAVALANDGARLARLRRELRARLLRSPVMNGAELASNLAKALRAMWHNHLS